LVFFSFEGVVVVAAVGDYGIDTVAAWNVSQLIESWIPDAILTLGDNNYLLGQQETIDGNIGKYYSKYIYPYNGSYGNGSWDGVNRFWPCPGNHDWESNLIPYRNYFVLPGNERYYNWTIGPAEFFSLDSDSREPDSIDRDGIQANWLREAVARSTASWKIVYMHSPPFSSSYHGSTPTMQWNFEQMGIDVVFAGHDHTYERLAPPNTSIPYLVNGLGGKSLYPFDSIADGSLFRFDSDYGAQKLIISDNKLQISFISVNHTIIDQITLLKYPPLEPSSSGPLSLSSILLITMIAILVLIFAVYAAHSALARRRRQLQGQQNEIDNANVDSVPLREENM